MAKAVQPPHPYYPVEANIIGYLANERSVASLLGTFITGCIVILGGTLMFVRQRNPSLPWKEKATILWFILSRQELRILDRFE